MARRPRSQLPDGFFHVTGRGVARSDIFLDDHDRAVFMGMLVRAAARNGWHCYAYCLLTNHYHLVLSTTQKALSAGMHRLNGGYAQSFNDRYARSGHVFQNRFDAFSIDDERHLRAACTYVLENAARAGLCAYGEPWRWAGALGVAPAC